MKHRLAQISTLALAGLVLTLTFSGVAQASAEKVIHDFNGTPDGSVPNAGVIFDAAGNLYGTTAGGGSAGLGIVYELSPSISGVWTENILYSFQGGTDGATPLGSLIFDHAGNLYGTTSAGGVYGGTVFELMPNGDGTWTEKVLFRANAFGYPVYFPSSNLVFDAAGNLYGTSLRGGFGTGNVFELSPNPDGSWTMVSIYNFSSDELNDPSTLIVDASGNLYGTIQYGGTNGFGGVFELSPSSAGWKINYPHNFKALPDGQYPTGGVILDSTGNLYGTTSQGGASSACACGTVFRLKSSKGGKQWTEAVIKSFSGAPDSGPIAGLVMDSSNKLYRVTY